MKNTSNSRIHTWIKLAPIFLADLQELGLVCGLEYPNASPRSCQLALMKLAEELQLGCLDAALTQMPYQSVGQFDIEYPFWLATFMANLQCVLLSSETFLEHHLCDQQSTNFETQPVEFLRGSQKTYDQLLMWLLLQSFIQAVNCIPSYGVTSVSYIVVSVIRSQLGAQPSALGELRAAQASRRLWRIPIWGSRLKVMMSSRFFRPMPPQSRNQWVLSHGHLRSI